jgi:uncharacterized protein YyaL (SSP411 family)
MKRIEHLEKSLDFLEESIDPVLFGSRAFYSKVYYPINKWSGAYPETTGYIIPTLLEVSKINKSYIRFQNLAIKMADWIIEIQYADGGLPGLIYKTQTNNEPSVFNGAQMIKGLIAAYKQTNESKYLEAAYRNAKWIVSNQENNGSWTRYLYNNKYFPSYYTRVAWPLLLVGKIKNDQSIINSAKKTLELISSKQLKNGFVKDSGFKPNTYAFLHTISYTIRGFLESSKLLDSEKFFLIASDFAEHFLNIFNEHGKLSGAYYEDFKPVNWYRCLTGESQMAIIWLKLFNETNDLKWYTASTKLLDSICLTQPMNDSFLLKKGGLPGSKPFYGRYISFRQPNWASKFFIDAILLEDKMRP